MNIGELKERIKSLPDDMEIMLVVSGSEVLSKIEKVAVPVKPEKIAQIKVCERDEKITWSCGYSDECIPPHGVELNDCANCPHGGYRMEPRIVPCRKYGKDVLAIKVA